MQFMSIGGVWVCSLFFKLVLMFPWEHFYTRILRDTCKIYYYFCTELVFYSTKLTIYGLFLYWISFLFNNNADLWLLLPNNHLSVGKHQIDLLKDREHTQTQPIEINCIIQQAYSRYTWYRKRPGVTFRKKVRAEYKCTWFYRTLTMKTKTQII